MRSFRRLVAVAVMVTGMAVATMAMDTATGVFDPMFRSLTAAPVGNPFAPPVLILGSADQLIVSFDELNTDRRYLRCRLVHCNADWQPSRLNESEYLNGFNLDEINDYAFSQGTTTHYVNYRYVLPNENMQPMVSGNYLLQVYDENDPDKVLLQTRFMVSENSAAVMCDATSRTDVDYNEAHQQLSVVVDTEDAHVRDPFNDLRVVISQNSRTDNAVQLQQPLRLEGKRAVYEHQRPLIFTAGNEYRRMETVSTRFPSMGVAEVEYRHPYYHFILASDAPRAEQQYLYDETQHGHFMIHEYEAPDPATQAEYGVVHFTLEMPRINGADVYLDGDFTRRRLDDEARMTYDTEAQAYTKACLLKQGAYNYQYLVVPHGAKAGITAPVEGNKYQTVNEYLVLVYHREPLSRYDRLIGAAVLMTM